MWKIFEITEGKKKVLLFLNYQLYGTHTSLKLVIFEESSTGLHDKCQSSVIVAYSHIEQLLRQMKIGSPVNSFSKPHCRYNCSKTISSRQGDKHRITHNCYQKGDQEKTERMKELHTHTHTHACVVFDGNSVCLHEHGINLSSLSEG